MTENTKKRVFPPVFRPIKPPEKFDAAQLFLFGKRTHESLGPKLTADAGIIWPPILGNPKPLWLKIRKRRRQWGPDWWEDDYHYATEWFSNYNPDDVERETVEYYESVLEDFSKSTPKLKLRAHNPRLQSRLVVPYRQPHVLRVFYWRHIYPVQCWYLLWIDPVLTGHALVNQEFKYSYVVPTNFFYRKLWWIPLTTPGYTPMDFFDEDYCYIYKRLDVEEFRKDYLLIDTPIGKITAKRIPWLFNFFARFLLDLQNVALISFWLDIKYRGFSVHMLRRRWRYFYNRIANLAFFETYALPVVLWYFIQHKRKALYAPVIAGWTSAMIIVVSFITYAQSLTHDERFRDYAFDSDLDTLRLSADAPIDPLLEEIYDPSDTTHSHAFSGPNMGFIGQDEITFLSRSHYTAPLFLSSWWITSNESLLHFLYLAERDFIIQPIGRIEGWCRGKLHLWFPTLEAWLMKKRFPGFRTWNMTRKRFWWWIRWQWMPWTQWGRPFMTQRPRFWRWARYYEDIKGIIYYYLMAWALVRDEINREIAHRLYDYEARLQADEDEIDERMLNGPPRQGYID